MAIDDALGVEFRNTGDGSGCLRGVEVNDFLGGLFEGKDDRVCGEDGELGMQFLKLGLARMMTRWKEIGRRATCVDEV